MRFVNNFMIKVNKEDLLKALKENRAKHSENYVLAVEQYRLECLAALKKRITDIEEGNISKMSSFMSFNMPSPVHFTHEYDTIIGMLEMATDETFDIDGTTYRAWVMDEWEWKERFTNDSIGYAIKARA